LLKTVISHVFCNRKFPSFAKIIPQGGVGNFAQGQSKKMIKIIGLIVTVSKSRFPHAVAGAWEEEQMAVV